MRIRRAATFALLIALVCAALAQTPGFPALSGRVVDEAGLLDSATRTALTQTLADLEAKSSDQLVVVTLRSLRGTSIEDYGYQLGRAWQIGQKDKNNGVLLIVAPNERKVRIEVGYGLEGTLTDAISKFIIETSILPRFKAGDFPGGIKRGVEDIVQVLTGDAEEYKRRAITPVASEMTTTELIIIIIFLLIAAFIVINVLAGVFVVVRDILAALGLAPKRDPRKRNRWFDSFPSSGGWSGGSSGGSSWSSGSSGGGFSGGGGGSFGGGGSSGSW
jgi:uncharacterized protein